jgi:beta-1,4-mannosyl-glycoprotein beta-1,4-N-acetylglucosaminyltransferase
MIFDFCSFLNENDLYEIRLKQYWDFVDKFIVVEVSETHTGLPKPLNFDHERFKPYAEKLVYVTFSSFQEEINKHPELLDDVAVMERGNAQAKDDWTRAYFQDNYLVKILNDLGAKDDDIVLMSCLDEFIKKSAFDQAMECFKNPGELFQGLRPIMHFHLDLYAYKLNLLHKPWQDHYAGLISEVSNFKKILPATIRHHGVSTHPNIPNGGWHFTALDDTDGEKVLNKYRSWAHARDAFAGQEIKFNYTTKEQALERFFHDYPVVKVEITEASHPKHVIDNIANLQNYIYKD